MLAVLPGSKRLYSARDFFQAGYSSMMAIELSTTPAATIAVSGSISSILVVDAMNVKQLGIQSDWHETSDGRAKQRPRR